MTDARYKENLLQAAREGNVVAIESFLASDIEHATKNALACAARDAAELAKLSLETENRRSDFNAFFERAGAVRRSTHRSIQPTQGHMTIIGLLARYPLGVVDETGPVPETRF